MNTIIGEGTMQIGGALRPYYIGTRQTAIFCELQGEGFDLQDYQKLFLEVGVNQFYAKEAREKGESFAPTGRKALTPTENSQFLYSALYAGAKREGIAIDFTVDDVSDWIDEAEGSTEETAVLEAAKPFTTHYQLLTQRLNRQNARPGKRPGPGAGSDPGRKQEEEGLGWAATLEEAFGVAGILPDVFWNLTWNDYDSLLYNHHYRYQQALSGHREVATRIYNSLGSFGKNFRAVAARDYWSLPLLDGPAPKIELPPASWWQHMEELAAKSGKRFAPIKD